MTFLNRATAHAPGSIGNIGPGLDVLGAALAGVWDSVSAEWLDEPGVKVLESGHPELPTDPSRHASAIAAAAVLTATTAATGSFGGRGVGLTVKKGLPLEAGQGGSAASAVAGAAAMNLLLGSPLTHSELLEACLSAEAVVAGRHLDNIAPSLLGGICLVRSMDPIDVVSLPVPARLRVVLAHPNQALRTADARAVLPASVKRSVAVDQMANVAAMVAALYEEDLPLLGRALTDRIAEPARAALIPGFAEAKAAALAAGALGASISGAGPTTFALCDSDVGAQRVAHAMRDAYESREVTVQVRVTRVDTQGVRTESEPVPVR